MQVLESHFKTRIERCATAYPYFDSGLVNPASGALFPDVKYSVAMRGSVIKMLSNQTSIEGRNYLDSRIDDFVRVAGLIIPFTASEIFVTDKEDCSIIHATPDKATQQLLDADAALFRQKTGRKGHIPKLIALGKTDSNTKAQEVVTLLSDNFITTSRGPLLVFGQVTRNS